MKRKTPPIPPEAYWNHPKAVALNSAGYGQLMRLIDHYWRTDCAPLPTVDHQLYILTRGYIATWKANRDDIKAILQDVIPELAKAQKRREDLRLNLRRLSDKGAVVKRSLTLEKRMASPVSHIKNDIPRIAERNRAAKIVTPVEAPPRNGFVDKTK